MPAHNPDLHRDLYNIQGVVPELSSLRVRYQEMSSETRRNGFFPITRKNLHFVHLLEQIVIDLLAHDRIELVSVMGPNEVPNPRRRCLELSGGAFVDEIEVFEQTPSLPAVDVQGVDVFVDEGY